MNIKTIYNFQWDPAKALANIRKHDVNFDQATVVFRDAMALTIYDEANSENDDRWFTLGFDASGRLLAVAHTYEMTRSAYVRIHIISARKATRRERRLYEEEPR